MWNGNQQTYPTQLDFSNQIQPPQQRFPTTNQWMNLPWTDPAIISLGNKLEPISSQWSTPTQSSGNNLISNPRWSQPTHLPSNGIYMPYSTTDGSRS